MLVQAAEESYRRGIRAIEDGRSWEATAYFEAAIQLDRKFGESGPWRRKKLKWLMRAAAALSLMVALLPLAIGLEVYRQRAIRFPYLFRFASALELPLIRGNHASIELSSPPRDWKITERRNVVKVSFQATQYPGVVFTEFQPDWESFRYLDLDVYLEDDNEVKMAFRIEDDFENATYHDRYNGKFELQPGPVHLRIPLSDVRSTPESRELDMGKIKKIVIFIRKPERPVTLYLADLRLSGASSPVRP